MQQLLNRNKTKQNKAKMASKEDQDDIICDNTESSETSDTTRSENGSHPPPLPTSSSSSSTSSPSSPSIRKMAKIPLLTTLASLFGAIVFGFSAGRFYSTGNVSLLVGDDANVDVVAPQCAEGNPNGTSSSQIDYKPNVLSFRYHAEIEKEDQAEENGDDDESESESSSSSSSSSSPVEGIGNLLQLHINAYGLEEHFEDYNGSNGDEIITEFLQDILEASDSCEEMYPLYGHYAHDSSKTNVKPTKSGSKTEATLQALGMFRYGMGQVNLVAWPKKGKIMADFLFIPPRSTETETYVDDDDDDDDDEAETDKTFYACIDSITRFLYPNDILEPSGLKGGVFDVAHVSQLGPFEALSKFGKDPFRFRWWIQKARGKITTMPDIDLLEVVESSDNWAHRVASVQSIFQSIDIIDTEDDYETMPLLDYYSDDESDDPNQKQLYAEFRNYMEAHPQFFRADRELYLDGVIQSTLHGLAAYHEALVQPAMFTHPNPKRVAIVGGGECATLREALKHRTVETVVMVEIDPVIVEVSKHYLPEWNDCSMFEGSSRYCMDDPRVAMYHLDALKWFRDRFSDEARLEGHELYGSEEKFDVVILDALDPQNAVDFVEALYGDGAFLNSLYNSLTDNGVLLTQVGESAYIGDVAETYPENLNYQRFLYEKAMKNQGFQAIMHYEESRSGFNGIWSFYAAFKDGSSRARWEMNDAQVDLEIRKRSIAMVDGRDLDEGEMKGPFEVFDGPTMATYRFPSKHSQVVYCLRDPQPYGCTTRFKDHYPEPSGFDPEIPNFSSDNFALGGGSSRGLIPRVTIPGKSYLMLEQSIHDVSITPTTSSILGGAFTSGDKDDIFGRTLDPVTRFVSGTPEGLTIPRRRSNHSTYRVDTGLLSFLKHGCGGTSNTETYHPFSLTEETANPEAAPTDGLFGRSYSNTVMRELVFNPSHTRNALRPEFLMSSRTIAKGDQIFSNFVPWYNEVGWNEHISSLRSQCSSSSQE